MSDSLPAFSYNLPFCTLLHFLNSINLTGLFFSFIHKHCNLLANVLCIGALSIYWLNHGLCLGCWFFVFLFYEFQCISTHSIWRIEMFQLLIFLSSFIIEGCGIDSQLISLLHCITAKKVFLYFFLHSATRPMLEHDGPNLVIYFALKYFWFPEKIKSQKWDFSSLFHIFVPAAF